MSGTELRKIIIASNAVQNAKMLESAIEKLEEEGFLSPTEYGELRYLLGSFAREIMISLRILYAQDKGGTSDE